MNDTPRGDRLHIALFGRRNAGKSSLINAITRQNIAVVSEVAGTTTDPVYKSMEVLPLGPVVFIDTPGIDDVGELGRLRIEKTREVLRKTDIALLVLGCDMVWGDEEGRLVEEFKKRSIPFIIVANQQDKAKNMDARNIYTGKNINMVPENTPIVMTSALTGYGIDKLIEALTKVKKEDDQRLHLIDGIVKEGDLVILVTPIDKAAPKGRLILPQQQVLRDILDNNAMALVVQDSKLEEALKKLPEPPAIVITDSQVFDRVGKILHENILLTSFSIIYARQKGNLKLFYSAVKKIEKLKDGDCILVAEGCTHHRKDDDIGTVKIPTLLKKKTGKKLEFHHVSGGFFEEDLSKYRLVIHCGACMLNKKEMEYRQEHALKSGIPMINYGIILAYLHGILDRVLEPFKKELE
ncbi:MAG: [FeFe] hydrogenase H-cluster maturation GTPase HydF [Firmicutes bacterium]|nr:[FeFe] hydrogenase H-cluster maturation GTPase HydF [Bacillota bacterium]